MQAQRLPTGTTAPMPAQEWLTFTLGNEEYAVEILRVQEIRGYDAVTAIANTPDFIKGVINLRGTIVPIVDLRIKFQVGTPTYDQFTVVIIVNVGARTIGMVVDTVSDVATLSAEQLKPPPAFGGALDTRYISGIGALDEHMLILVDIERLLMSEEMALFDSVTE